MPRFVLAATALCSVPAAHAIACGASDLMTNTDANIVAYRKATAADVPACCAACTADAKCDFFSFDAHETANNCHLKEGSPDGHHIDNATGYTTSIPGPPAPTPAPTKPNPPLGYQPNIVLFLQDDQDKALGGWDPMAKADKLLVAGGAEATNWFIHTPVCCPSRGEILSGRYFHNIREPTPKGGCMHVDTDAVNPASFAKHLGDAGYTIGYFGKHMNSCPERPPPGFDCPSCYWFANGGGKDAEPGGYLNASFHQYAQELLPGGANGTYKADTNGEFGGYTTSIIGNKSIAWVRRVAAAADRKPFMVTVASKGPHVPSTPAPWYATAFADRLAPRTPDYNASAEVLQHHHWLIAQQQPISESEGGEIDELFRNRWRTLLSVDDAIEGMVDAIEELGLTNSTYFFITSDHGYSAFINSSRLAQPPLLLC
jgi:arylsulfatase A-like enzyme